MVLALLGCSEAPEPGDLAAFCSLLESGTGLEPTPTAEDLERLVLVAPPAIRPTIEGLQSRARDFDELLALDPPDLEALFTARFDRAATQERNALGRYAESSCGIATEWTPPTRWNDFVQANFSDAPWSAVPTQFETSDGRIDTATMVFAEAPDPISQVEDACRAMAEFLVADGADPARVRVFVGSVEALDSTPPDGTCQLP